MVWYKDYKTDRLHAWNLKKTEKDLFVQKGQLNFKENKNAKWKVIIKNQKTGTKKILKKNLTELSALKFANNWMKKHPRG